MTLTILKPAGIVKKALSGMGKPDDMTSFFAILDSSLLKILIL